MVFQGIITGSIVFSSISHRTLNLVVKKWRGFVHFGSTDSQWNRYLVPVVIERSDPKLGSRFLAPF